MNSTIVAMMIFIGLHTLWRTWLKPLISGKTVKTLRGYQMHGYFLLPNINPNPDGSYLCLMAHKSTIKDIRHFLGMRNFQVRYDGWWWEPFLVKAYPHELKNPAGIISIESDQIAMLGNNLLNKNIVKELKEVLQ